MKKYVQRSAVYFISDTHFGGEGELAEVDILDELKQLLQLISKNKGGELIIVGDVFGIWEFSDVKGLEAFNKTVEQQQEVIQLLASYADKAVITFLPGNHDHILACYSECKQYFAKLNINLEQSQVVLRQVGDKKIWLEHGNQLDPANKFEPFGNDSSTPLGYYITESLVAAVGKYSKRGKKNWLKNLQSIGSNAEVPKWLLSGYFYNEMAKLIQVVAIPMLIFLGYSLLALLAQLLKLSGLVSKNYLIHNFITEKTSYVGNLLSLIIWTDIIIMGLAAILLLPGVILLWDFKQFINRYKLTSIYKEYAIGASHYKYEIDKIIDDNDDVDFYVYGHTHKSLARRHGKAWVLNTGTWLKRYKRIKLKGILLPDVYIPYYELGYFKIDGTSLSYQVIPKKIDLSELTILQRILILPYKKSATYQLQPFEEKLSQ